MTRAAATKTLMQATASKLSLVKAKFGVIREISPLVGIALLVFLITHRCPLHVHLCVVAVHMPQDGSKDSILPWQTVKWLVKFVTIGQAIVVDGETTLKSRTAAPFTCMSWEKRLYARLDIVVSIDVLEQRDAIDLIAVISGLTSKWIEIERVNSQLCIDALASFECLSRQWNIWKQTPVLPRLGSNTNYWETYIKKREMTVVTNNLECM